MQEFYSMIQFIKIFCFNFKTILILIISLYDVRNVYDTNTEHTLKLEIEYYIAGVVLEPRSSFPSFWQKVHNYNHIIDVNISYYVNNKSMKKGTQLQSQLIVSKC